MHPRTIKIDSSRLLGSHRECLTASEGSKLKKRAKTDMDLAIHLRCIQCAGGVVGKPGWGKAVQYARECGLTSCSLYPWAFERKV